jgi:glycosyltransferase involved in cell wall biosynthesis
MNKCVDSIITEENDIEIILVNDGSTDETKFICDEYQKKYPDLIKVIHQKNSGHGGAVNTGISFANGKYVKVVDSDDWIDRNALIEIIKTLRKLLNKNCNVDMFISNFVYEKAGVKKKKIMHYTNVLPENKVFNWNKIGNFKKGKYLLMHSVIFSREILNKCNLKLPLHTFYVDNLYVYTPLQYVNNMYYLNVKFYHYYIGRTDQSVNEDIMIKNIDQQIKVNKLMLKELNIEKIENKKQRQYIFNYFEIVTVISFMLIIRSKNGVNLEKKQELWDFIQKESPWVYNKLVKSYLGIIFKFPDKICHSISSVLYLVSQKIFGFN